MKSDVYLVRIVSSDIRERTSGLEKVIHGLTPFSIYKKDELIPIKITVGESACVYNISPELVRVLVLDIREKGAKPFLFDTSVIYQGRRQNAVDHLKLALDKGFVYPRVEAPFIVADGLWGQDGKEFTVNSHDIRKIKIPSFIGMLDSLVVLSHATGHIVSGYAGAIKNVAMGMCCRPTKQAQHSSLKPSVIEEKCTACGCCVEICPVEAVSLKNKAFINQKICIGCGECLCACKFDAISINWQEEPKVFCRRMVDVASFILPKFKNKLFINFALDITKDCDCISNKDDKIISDNIGILVSEDIVSLDKATVDLAKENKKSDFLKSTEDIYESMLEYAVKRGLGSLDYNLLEL